MQILKRRLNPCHHVPRLGGIRGPAAPLKPLGHNRQPGEAPLGRGNLLLNRGHNTSRQLDASKAGHSPGPYGVLTASPD